MYEIRKKPKGNHAAWMKLDGSSPLEKEIALSVAEELRRVQGADFDYAVFDRNGRMVQADAAGD